jgi:hypothetical protein
MGNWIENERTGSILPLRDFDELLDIADFLRLQL